MVLEQVDILQDLLPLHNSLFKINLRWPIDLDTKGQTKKLLGENIFKNLPSLCLGTSFLDKTQKQFPKLKNNGTNVILLN